MQIARSTFYRRLARHSLRPWMARNKKPATSRSMHAPHTLPKPAFRRVFFIQGRNPATSNSNRYRSAQTQRPSAHRIFDTNRRFINPAKPLSTGTAGQQATAAEACRDMEHLHAEQFTPNALATRSSHPIARLSWEVLAENYPHNASLSGCNSWPVIYLRNATCMVCTP